MVGDSLILDKTLYLQSQVSLKSMKKRNGLGDKSSGDESPQAWFTDRELKTAQTQTSFEGFKVE